MYMFVHVMYMLLQKFVTGETRSVFMKETQRHEVKKTQNRCIRKLLLSLCFLISVHVLFRNLLPDVLIRLAATLNLCYKPASITGSFFMSQQQARCGKDYSEVLLFLFFL